MIIGCVGIGGKGTRLGMTFSKEMLPQRNYMFYNPISNHLVSKMEEAYAEHVYFIHGLELKQDVVNFYKDVSKYTHITQNQLGFANVLNEFINYVKFDKTDSILFGMPDTIFEENPFIKMVELDGVVSGLFTTDAETKVDRLYKDANKFKIKSKLTDELTDNFWGILKFDGKNLLEAHKENLFEKYTEVGDIVNFLGFKTIQGNKYIDLGTWPNYNRYLSKGYY